jgi:formylglycine-generating enzyme required for sulfatase activity/tRNA A-37 threonylcarbamoyl transferase component Bud32
MAVANASKLMQTIRTLNLIETDKLDEAEGLVPQIPDIQALAKELFRRGILTAFQIKKLAAGKGMELVLGEYVLLDLLGQGGMGQVFKARQRRLNRLCALKIILADNLGSEAALTRFHREAEAAARLDHPNIVRIYDASEARGVHFLAMEFIDGVDLSSLLKQSGQLAVSSACDYMRQAALGLQHAHMKGLIHRDFKPANLMLTRDGVIKILDMGIARFQAGKTDVTGTGMVMGTPDYLSPEQAIDAKHVTIQADLYSLGCSLYHLLAGRVPFGGDNLTTKLLAHQRDEPTPLDKLRPGLPRELVAVVSKLMAKRPQDRYSTPAELAEVLRQFVAGSPSNSGATAILDTRSAAAVSEQQAILNTLTGIANGPGQPADTGPLQSLAVTEGVLPSRYSGSPRSRRGKKPSAKRGLLLAGIGAAATLLLALGAFLIFRSPAAKDPDPGDDKPRTPEKLFTNSIGMKLARIPEGQFLMGEPDFKERSKQDDDGPAHLVTISKPFYLGIHEVTQREYEAVIGKNPSFFNDKNKGGPDFPVEQVSWDDAAEFCTRLSAHPEEKKAGRVYRLPTEAEWEYACRAGTSKLYHYGNGLSSHEANIDGNFPYGGATKGPFLKHTTKGGTYKSNAWGLFDMHGNVREWCNDWYDETYYSRSERTDPKGPLNGKYRVVRSGSWFLPARNCRSAFRTGLEPSFRNDATGFRVAATVP